MFDVKSYWNSRYKVSNSGSGSYGLGKDIKIGEIKHFVKQADSVLDIGCGDFSVGIDLYNFFKPSRYEAVDISDVIIKKNKDSFPMIDFAEIDYKKKGKYNLVLCLDVLYHTIGDYEKIIKFIKNQKARYYAIMDLDIDLGKAGYIKKQKFNKHFIKGLAKEIKIPQENSILYLYDRDMYV